MGTDVSWLLAALCIVGLLLFLKKYLPQESRTVHHGNYVSDVTVETSTRTVNGKTVHHTKADINGVKFETNKDVAAIRDKVVHFRDGSKLDLNRPEDRENHPDVTFLN